jgi:hypothetical protein
MRIACEEEVGRKEKKERKGEEEGDEGDRHTNERIHSYTLINAVFVWDIGREVDEEEEEEKSSDHAPGSHFTGVDGETRKSTHTSYQHNTQQPNHTSQLARFAFPVCSGKKV